MSVTVELSELDAVLWDAFKRGGEWVNASEYRKLKAENSKLRELVRGLLTGYECGWGELCDGCTWTGIEDPHEFRCPARVKARELGVEVNDG